MLIDDIGSFPLPPGIDREWIERNFWSKEYEEMVQRAFLMKSKYVEVPNYPQFRDMVRMFLDPMKDPELQDDAYLISEKAAIIPEVELVEKIKVEKLRVCITGIFELYYREFGGVIYDDVLHNFAESVYRFARNATKYDNVVCLSFDEPSLGVAPDLQPAREQIESAYDFKLNVDTQVHLHEPLFYDRFLETGIEIIGIEAARDPRKMDAIDVEVLESAEKRIRIGVARTDVDCIISEFNERHNVNAWRSEELSLLAVEELESAEKILERLKIAKKKFGDLLSYIGPDCGLFAFPSQRASLKLLENVKRAKELWTT